jgi:hypothetical protein
MPDTISWGSQLWQADPDSLTVFKDNAANGLPRTELPVGRYNRKDLTTILANVLNEAERQAYERGQADLLAGLAGETALPQLPRNPERGSPDQSEEPDALSCREFQAIRAGTHAAPRYHRQGS